MYIVCIMWPTSSAGGKKEKMMMMRITYISLGAEDQDEGENE